MSTELIFPADFVWGASTSSYQIEGAFDEDGRGLSIWDTFARTPGKIEDGDTGAVASDHYHRWRQDVALMSEIGLKAYRFSIAWPRILPQGSGRINQAGIDFYSRLVDELLEAGIQPTPTLFHWDLPQPLEDKGGWASREVLGAFSEYTDAITRALGDRVKVWMTVNEPSVVAWLGYLEGVHAPGRTSWPDSLAAAHHLLMAHGLGVKLVRENVAGATVGPALQFVPAEPASPSAADARLTEFFDGMWNHWFHDPIHGLGYPKSFVQRLVDDGHIESPEMPFIQDGDMDIISIKNDFLGINYYSRAVLRADTEDNEPPTVVRNEEFTEMKWEVYPASLNRAFDMLAERYPGHPDLYITENGAAYGTGPDEHGVVNDTKRVAYLDGHLRAAHQAIQDGVPLKGYYLWSLLDNFEWAFGMTKRFGIIWVDYNTLERTPKASARWYSDVIRRNGLVPETQETV